MEMGRSVRIPSNETPQLTEGDKGAYLLTEGDKVAKGEGNAYLEGIYGKLDMNKPPLMCTDEYWSRIKNQNSEDNEK